jgi:hypothetical protein
MADTGQHATLTSILGIFVTSETAYEEFPEKMAICAPVLAVEIL